MFLLNFLKKQKQKNLYKSETVSKLLHLRFSLIPKFTLQKQVFYRNKEILWEIIQSKI